MNLLEGVAAAGKRDAWAVGTTYRGQTPVNRPYVLHWNGRSWRAVAVPGTGPLTTYTVASSSPVNVWIAGPTPPIGQSEAVHWDGAAWHVIRMPSDASFADLVTFGPADTWVAGQDLCNFNSVSCSTQMWHWTGHVWQEFVLNLKLGGFNADGISGSSAGNVWVVGTRRFLLNGKAVAELVAYRWNGLAWRWVRMPHPLVIGSGGDRPRPQIAVAAPDNVWIAAASKPRPGQNPVFVQHWDGLRWHTLRAPAGDQIVGLIAPDGRRGLWLGNVTHWTGRQWIWPVGNALGGAYYNFYAVALVPGTTTVWAAGAVGFKPESLIMYNGPFPR